MDDESMPEVPLLLTIADISGEFTSTDAPLAGDRLVIFGADASRSPAIKAIFWLERSVPAKEMSSVFTRYPGTDTRIVYDVFFGRFSQYLPSIPVNVEPTISVFTTASTREPGTTPDSFVIVPDTDALLADRESAHFFIT